MKNPKIPAVSNMQEYVMEVHATNMYTLSTSMLFMEQIWNITCEKLALQLHHNNKGNFQVSNNVCKWYTKKTIHSQFET